MTEPVIELDGVDKTYRFFRLSGRAPAARARTDHGLRRPERRRQVHDHPHPDGDDPPGSRHGPRPRPLAAARAGGREAGHRLRLRGHAPATAPRRSPGTCASSRRSTRTGTRSTRTRCCQRFNLHPEQPIRHAVARRARQGHAAARARAGVRACCCSTSRPPASIRSRGTKFSPSSWTSSATSAARFCSRRTTRRTSSRSPIRSRSSIAAGSSTRATRRRSSIGGAGCTSRCPAGVTAAAVPGVVETTTSGRIAVVTTKAYTPDLDAVYERAGVTVRDGAAHDARGDLRRQRHEQSPGEGRMSALNRPAADPQGPLPRPLDDRRRPSSAGAAAIAMMPLSERLRLCRRRLAHLHAHHPQHLPGDERRRAGEEGQGPALHPEPAGVDDAVRGGEGGGERHRLPRALARPDGRRHRGHRRVRDPERHPALLAGRPRLPPVLLLRAARGRRWSADSTGWHATAIIVGNVSVNFLIPFLLSLPSVSAHAKGADGGLDRRHRRDPGGRDRWPALLALGLAVYFRLASTGTSCRGAIMSSYRSPARPRRRSRVRAAARRGLPRRVLVHPRHDPGHLGDQRQLAERDDQRAAVHVAHLPDVAVLLRRRLLRADDVRAQGRARLLVRIGPKRILVPLVAGWVVIFPAHRRRLDLGPDEDLRRHAAGGAGRMRRRRHPARSR